MNLNCFHCEFDEDEAPHSARASPKSESWKQRKRFWSFSEFGVNDHIQQQAECSRLTYIHTNTYLYIGIPTTCVSVHILWTLLQFQLFCLWFTLQMKLSLGAALFFSLSQQEQQRNLIVTFINDLFIFARGFLHRKLYIPVERTTKTAHWLSICLSIWYWSHRSLLTSSIDLISLKIFDFLVF